MIRDNRRKPEGHGARPGRLAAYLPICSLAWLVLGLMPGAARAQTDAPAMPDAPKDVIENGPKDVIENGPDYDDTSEHWNGLQTLTAVAKGLGLAVEVTSELDWDEVEAGDVLFLLYPTRRVDPGQVAAFVRNGGHLLLADDFGDSTEAMGRLGMLREDGAAVAADRYYRDLPFAPVARAAAPEHPLAAGVDELTTNHPAVLVQVRGPEVIFEFSPGKAVVAAGALGSGRFVVVSDPSLFINRMLQFADNLQFAINALRFLSGGDADRRLLILTGEFSVYGEPSGVLDDGTMHGTLGNSLSELNRWLDELNDYLLTMPGMRVVAVLIAGLIGLIAMVALPLARKTRLDGGWTRAEASTLAPDDFETLVKRYERGGQGANYLLPATVIRDTVNHCLARIINREDPLYNHLEHEISRALVKTRGQAAAAAFKRLYRPLSTLPTRAVAASQWSTGHVSRREFERLHEDALELYLALGEEAG